MLKLLLWPSTMQLVQNNWGENFLPHQVQHIQDQRAIPAIFDGDFVHLDPTEMDLNTTLCSQRIAAGLFPKFLYPFCTTLDSEKGPLNPVPGIAEILWD